MVVKVIMMLIVFLILPGLYGSNNDSMCSETSYASLCGMMTNVYGNLSVANEICQGKVCHIHDLEYGILSGNLTELIWSNTQCDFRDSELYFVYNSRTKNTRCEKRDRTFAIACCKDIPNNLPRSLLFIIADDLRTDLNFAYGDTNSVTKNLDQFAKTAMTFQYAYAQLPSCNPSRSSLLTGRFPEEVGVFGKDGFFVPNFYKEFITLPQFMRQLNVTSVGIGKVFHPFMDPGEAYDRFLGPNNDPQCRCFEIKLRMLVNPVKPPCNCEIWGELDRVIDFYRANQAISELERLARIPKQEQKPFFLALGFQSPHEPYEAHQYAWVRTKFGLQYPFPKNSTNPEPLSPLRGSVSDFQDYGYFRGRRKYRYYQQGLRSSYAALVTQVDLCFGEVMDRLESLGMSSTTAIIFTSDNGFSLGEGDLWGKNNVNELSVHVPLMIRIPWIPQHRFASLKSEGFVQLLDLYRTSADILGLSAQVPASVRGISMLPLIQNQGSIVDAGWSQNAAFSQVYRNRKGMGADYHEQVRWTGYSIRTRQWRYIGWVNTASADALIGNVTFHYHELYDHSNDSELLFGSSENRYNLEIENLAQNPAFVDLIRFLQNRILSEYGPPTQSPTSSPSTLSPSQTPTTARPTTPSPTTLPTLPPITASPITASRRPFPGKRKRKKRTQNPVVNGDRSNIMNEFHDDDDDSDAFYYSYFYEIP